MEKQGFKTRAGFVAPVGFNMSKMGSLFGFLFLLL